ncbi:MAG TPA: heat-inducible transcription repressor HrcA [Candidatus Atribacteria bacterium]|nr:MAG: Heat-inducible transcription repressor hrcA [Atribacteria bacterium 34_128]HAJ34007.1 heat-inducible transcription repressor HrcA [Candidatus Atribacteria bacterium]
MELNERMKNILTAVVHRYITTAEPVSSAIIAEKYNLNLSTATIRHEMYLLEKNDYLWQPHTSSGRIPTDRGYRFYVDNLMVKNYLKEKEKREIIQIYKKSKEFEETMKITSQLLSKLTNNIGVVLAPVIYNDLVKNIQFISVGNNRILTIIVTDAGLICQKIINVSGEISKDRLNYLSNFINSKLAEKDVNITNLNNILMDELDKIISFQKRFNYIQNFLEECFDIGYSEKKVYLNGRINIMKHPEFKETDKLNYILSLIEEENILADTIRRYLGFRKTKIIIGKESKLKEMQNCSLVTSEYSIKGKPAGAIGILGPTRMDYPRMVSIAEYISDKLSEILSEF